MKRRRHGLMLGVSWLWAGALGGAPAQAQTASQITPSSYAPALERPATPVVIPQGPGVTAPPGSEALVVTLSGVRVDGLAIEPAELATLRETLVGHPVSIAEIFATARALETWFAASGRVLVRVSVPAQQLDNGAELRLVVTAGQIESVDTSNLPPPVRGRIAHMLAPLVGQSAVTMASIERRLLLAGDTPGVALRSTLAPGTTPGGTVLIISADYRPVSGYLTLDNNLPRALGGYALGLGVNFNTMLGLGETIYLRASGFPNGGNGISLLDATPRNRALVGGVVVPLGTNGLTFNVEATDARTAPRHDALSLGTASKFQRISARLAYPFVRSRALTVSGELAFDTQREAVDAISPLWLPLSLDRMRIARAAGSVSGALAGGGSFFARLEASIGIDGLGARSAADATPLLPLSRQGADASFTKLMLDISLRQPVPAGFTIAVNGRAQTAFGDALVNAEQIGLATLDGVSPLRSGTLQGDSGYVARAELARPIDAALGTGRAEIAPYLFGVAGNTHLARPTIFERRSTDVYAFGAGARFQLRTRRGAPGLSTALEWGRAHIERAGNADRVTFTMITRF